MYFSNHWLQEDDGGGEGQKVHSLLGLTHAQQRMGEGVYRQRNPVGDAGLVHQFRNVGLDRSLFDSESSPNFFVGSSGNQQMKHLPFALGEDQRFDRSGAAGNVGDPLDELADKSARRPDGTAMDNSNRLLEFGSRC